MILVGLTPGLTQVIEAAVVYSGAAPETRDGPTAFRELLRNKVAFAGSMRRNLCVMLDELGLQEPFSLSSCASMFSGDRTDIATTSAFVFPVFTGDDLQNFSGGSKPLATIPLFKVNVGAASCAAFRSRAERAHYSVRRRRRFRNSAGTIRFPAPLRS